MGFQDSIKKWEGKFFFCESDGIRGFGGGNEVAGVSEDDGPHSSREEVRREECGKD